jgi:hypothetical protein
MGIIHKRNKRTNTRMDHANGSNNAPCCLLGMKRRALKVVQPFTPRRKKKKQQRGLKLPGGHHVQKQAKMEHTRTPFLSSTSF